MVDLNLMLMAAVLVRLPLRTNTSNSFITLFRLHIFVLQISMNVNPVVIIVSRSAATLRAPLSVVVNQGSPAVEQSALTLMSVLSIMEAVSRSAVTLGAPLSVAANQGSPTVEPPVLISMSVMWTMEAVIQSV